MGLDSLLLVLRHAVVVMVTNNEWDTKSFVFEIDFINTTPETHAGFKNTFKKAYKEHFCFKQRGRTVPLTFLCNTN